jgi:polar amino acid transport system permease protein
VSVGTSREPRLDHLQRQRLTRGVAYGAFALAVVLVATSADWGRVLDNFARPAVARRLFPGIITIALRNTVIYTLAGFTLGLFLGLGIALMRLSTLKPYRWVAMAYIEVFRGLPALLIFIFIGTGIPLAFPSTEIPGGTYGKVALALGLVSAAYLAETIRAGIQAVPKGQMEAARSLGMPYGRAMWSIVIPQAFRIIIPPLTNELVLLFKDSSLVLFLGVALDERELTKYGRDLAGQVANITPIAVAGALYLVITVPLGILVRRLEARRDRAR